MTAPSPDLVSAWAHALAGSSTVPTSSDQDDEFTTRLAEWVTRLPDDAEAASKTGAAMAGALIDAHYTQPESLAATLLVLDENFPPHVGDKARTALRAGLAAEFAGALRERTRTEQESIRRAVLSAYRTGEARFRAVFRDAAVGIGIADSRGLILEVNQRMAAMLGFEAHDARGIDLRSFGEDSDPPDFWKAYDELLAGERSSYSTDKQLTHTNGTVVWTHMRASSVQGDDGSVALLIGLFEDITERRRMNERLLHQATHDPLTGLPNRDQLLERLDHLLSTAGPDERLGLCFLDLDGFKGVNDTLGHQAGDQLLTTIAHRLTEATDSERHLVARMGGDEFVLLVPGTQGPESVIAIAETVLEAVRQPLVLDGHSLTVTASLGLVERPAAGADATELLRAADITLYWAKSDGKACWALFDEDRNSREVTRYALSQALPAALESGELFLEYQPIIGLADGLPHALEALVRWNHPVRGLLGPDQFVPLAEETGVIVALGRWVLHQAAADAASWPKTPDGKDVAVAVNVAVRQVRDPGLFGDVLSALAEAGIPPERLNLEITESALMDTGEEGKPALATLYALADHGVTIAIDDFGTGYSNLTLLRRLPADCLKIDSSFVADLAGDNPDPSAESIVVSLITLAHACGMTVTAEGVETPEQARRLTELGVDTAQGYHYSKPVPAAEVPALLTAAR